MTSGQGKDTIRKEIKEQMATITIKTPFEGQTIKVIWENGKVRVRGSKNALLFWSDMKSRGMYGKYGHTVDFQDTLLTDVVIALQNRASAANISWDKEAQEIMDKEAKEEKPFPKGAVS